MINDFCVFILTHGRPDNVYTYNALIRAGYTGKIYIIIDNEDKTADEYYKIFGKKVIMFDKQKIAKSIDEGDNFNDRRAIIYARNACFNIAEKLKYKYFIELDDDYTLFRYGQFENKLKTLSIKTLDSILINMLNYYKSINAKSIAMFQGGDFIHGVPQDSPKFRKCMNTFICSTERPFTFNGRINEDVNTYTNLGGRGELFLSIIGIRIEQKDTQKTKGGMADTYLDNGTYIKSFYTVMYSPSCAKVKLMQSKHPRLHHSISWNNTVPMIINEKYKK